RTAARLGLSRPTRNGFSMFQQYVSVGLGLLAGDLERFTGRDLQPSWAHVPGSSPAVAAALTADVGGSGGSSSGNGRADKVQNIAQKTPAPGDGRGAGATRRPRPGNQGKGRKRGKR